MKRFKNILLLHECDRATLNRAATLAKDNRAHLTLVHVVNPMPDQWHQAYVSETPIDLQKLAISKFQAHLDELVAPLKQDGVRVSTRVLTGTPFLEVIRDVISQKRDLVMMTAERKGGLRERLFGSMSLRLMRKCPCPVWVMKPTRRQRFLRILAAVDPDPTDKVRDSLNGTILELASSLAVEDSAELHVAHAWTLFGEQFVRGQGLLVDPEIRKLLQGEADKHHKLLDALLAKHTEVQARVHMINGNADTVIPRLTKTKKADLLVMGTICRTGIPGFLIGNTAEKILDEVNCSVLTVKPEGFVSPVTVG